MRQRFRDLRQQIGAYQAAIASAKTLHDLESARLALRQVAGRHSQEYAQPDRGRIQEITNYYQRALYGNRSLAPLSYRDEVLFKPPEWLRQWWLRRNAIHICDISQELEALEGLAPAVRRLFAGGLDLDDLAAYRKFAVSLDALYF